MNPPDIRRQVPVPRRRLLHVVDAAGYSLAGLRLLLQETAARQELVAAVAGGLLLVWQDGSLAQVLIYAGLCLAVLIVETLNTALEVLTDHVSPEWSIAAKHAKDLGSLAVGLTLCLPLGYLAAACLGPAP